MEFYIWLCLYIANKLLHGPLDYYVYMWLIFFTGMMMLILGALSLFLIPQVKTESEEPMKPSHDFQRHRRPRGVADPYLQELVDRRRNERLAMATL